MQVGEADKMALRASTPSVHTYVEGAGGHKAVELEQRLGVRVGHRLAEAHVRLVVDALQHVECELHTPVGRRGEGDKKSPRKHSCEPLYPLIFTYAPHGPAGRRGGGDQRQVGERGEMAPQKHSPWVTEPKCPSLRPPPCAPSPVLPHPHLLSCLAAFPSSVPHLALCRIPTS